MNSGASPVIVSDGTDQCFEIAFGTAPDAGSLVLDFGSYGTTGPMAYDATNASIATEIAGIFGSSNVEVVGTIGTTLYIKLIGVESNISAPTEDPSTDLTTAAVPVVITITQKNARIAPTFKYVVAAGAHGFLIPQEIGRGRSLYITGAVADVTSGSLLANFLG
jgi:hypothetical protein